MSALWQGARKRAISATDMNEHSSRSHTIFTVNIELTPLDSGEEDAARVIRRSKVRSPYRWRRPNLARHCRPPLFMRSAERSWALLIVSVCDLLT